MFIKKILNDKTSDEEILMKVNEWQKTKDKKLLQEIINRHIFLIEKIAKTYQSKDVEMHDLVAEGILGLVHGLEKFQFTHKVKPSTYFYYWVRSKISLYSWRMRNFINVSISNKNYFVLSVMKELKEEKITYEEAIYTICKKENITPDEAKHNINILSHRIVNLNNKIKEDSDKETSWDDLLENDEHELMIEDIENKNLQKLIEESLKTLNEKERIVINKRFFSENPMTLKEIGDEMSMSTEGIRNIEIRSIKKLKETLLIKLNKKTDLSTLYLIFLLSLKENTL
jgi:RNA polymerase sigma factor (sigma-70 family)